MSVIKKILQYKPHPTEKDKEEELSPRQLKIRHKKSAREKRIGRWTVGVVFTLTVGSGLLFLVINELPGFWEKLTSPAVIATLPEESGVDLAPLRAEIEETVRGKQGEYGVYARRKGQKGSLTINEAEVFPAASLMKLPVMVALYQEAEAGRMSLDEEYKLVEGDKLPGAGVLAAKPAGTVYSYRQLVQLMAHYSDNTAFKIVRRRLGDELIQRKIEELGMSRTSLAKNETTPVDMGLLWEKLMNGKVLTVGHREELLGFLTNTAFEDRIPAGVPEGVRVVHKIGTDLGVYSDSGIVFADAPFVLVVMSKEAREVEAKEVIVEITGEVASL